MSQSNLEALINQADIQTLREIIQQDPNIAFIQDQLRMISEDIGKTLNDLYDPNIPGVPVLDLSDPSVKQANQWLRDLQVQQDRMIFYNVRLDEYDSIIQDHWTRATNLCMIHPVIEGLRSNDQRMAYIETAFESLSTLLRNLKLVRRKIQILQDRSEGCFKNLQQQQRNLQILAQVSRIYGNSN